jgi:hypothetical protein
MPRLDDDPLDLALRIKRGFEKTLGSRDKPKPIDSGYLLGVAVWWLVIFAAASIMDLRWIPAAMIATLVCGFWPVVLLFDRARQD